MKKKEIAKRTSSSPAKIISDRMELSKSSSHRNQSVRLPNAHPDDHPAASATTTASLDVTCDSSTTSQHHNVLYDTEQNVKLFKENPQSGMNEGRVPDNSSNSLSPISLVTDDHSDSSDKENHVVQGSGEEVRR
ncbi:hypothetical protein E2C01_083266 [Portunus trituberculatus]|uniref:Uncharacterized protein n=1 Tax=Portunus trituberculatus TaxID=210409 RepID=A0A5B7J0R0_PORTR|nr:hypothetical protein [Portunus trituberculatus]